MRVLTWNLYHGRAVPPAGRDLHDRFATTLAASDWDVALLQEVPPWWPAGLARACNASMRMALTARHELPALRRWAATRWPDVLKSNGGGCNAILIRAAAIEAHRSLRLRRWPERRVVHGVRLGDGTWVANVHAQVRPHAAARRDLALAAAAVLTWAQGAGGAGGAVILGGDANVRDPAVPGLTHLGGHGVDHVLGRGVTAAGPPVVCDRGGLSDHAPVIVPVSVSAPASTICTRTFDSRH